ncbi:MCAT [Symbiodinium sp. CCMP2592]|nr:MCAT [Symbiodinium sp. CCMP2592]
MMVIQKDLDAEQLGGFVRWIAPADVSQAMPVLQGGDWYHIEGETPAQLKEPEQKAENKPGHRPLGSYKLPTLGLFDLKKWVYHPERANRRIVINKEDYFGMAADGLRNFDLWNVAHVAAYHDDLKLLSMATLEQCKEPNRWGMTPMHMTGLGQHPYGPSLCVLWELVQMGAADPMALNSADQSPWHIAQRMQKPSHLKKWEKVVFKGGKPEEYDSKKEAQLKPRGKFARALGLDPAVAEDTSKPLPVCLVFPGQGAQYVGMLQKQKDLPVLLRRLRKDLPAVKAMLAKAKEVLGYDLAEILQNGPEDKLAETKYCQPAMYIAGMAALEQLKLEEEDKVSRCRAVAGLSLGEYVALTAAGVFDFETGLRLIKVRSEAMQFELSGGRPGAKAQGMCLVVGLVKDEVERLCKECAGKGETCQIAACLFSRAFSVAGSRSAVESFVEKSLAAGALQCSLLKNSGAFHTPEMLDVRNIVVKELEAAKASMKPPRCTVYANATAKAIGPDTPIQDLL